MELSPSLLFGFDILMCLPACCCCCCFIRSFFFARSLFWRRATTDAHRERECRSGIEECFSITRDVFIRTRIPDYWSTILNVKIVTMWTIAVNGRHSECVSCFICSGLMLLPLLDCFSLIYQSRRNDTLKNATWFSLRVHSCLCLSRMHRVATIIHCVYLSASFVCQLIYTFGRRRPLIRRFTSSSRLT